LYRYAADKSIKNVKEISKLRWCVIESKKENHHSVTGITKIKIYLIIKNKDNR
jgi:hypothetical protein